MALYFITSSLSAYNNVLVGEIALYLIALAGLSLLTGTTGQNLPWQRRFYGSRGIHLCALMTHTHLNFFLELLAAIGAAAVLGLVIGISATRLKGPYLAGATLLLALALPRSQISGARYSAETRGSRRLSLLHQGPSTRSNGWPG